MMTDIKDAKLIVPTDALWVAIKSADWEYYFSEGPWNDMLQVYSPIIPVDSVRVSRLAECPKRSGWVLRPLDEYRDFVDRPISVRT